MISGETITGMLTGFNEWIWDTFSFVDGTIGDGPYYYLLLDFTNNDFTRQSSIELTVPDGQSIDLLHRDDKTVILLLTENTNKISIIQKNQRNKLVQTIDLSGLEFEPE